ncbi:MAG: streptothricin acetyltransferase [Lachnospiraceae bacterium]|nr:streptothricin acetyltransferase [Lachnospiraceae bacterium]
MEIVKMSSDTLKDMNKVSEPFEIIGKIKPTFVNDKWTYTEEIYDCSYLHSYPNEECDYSLYIENPDKAVFCIFR